MSRKRPSNEEVIDAIKASIPDGRPVRFDRVRYQTQLKLKTTAKFARQWVREALLAPGQEDLVWLWCDDDKRVHRVQEDPDNPAKVAMADLHEGALLSMGIDWSGCRVNPLDNSAQRNEWWIAQKSIVDIWVGKLLEEEEGRAKKIAAMRAEQDSEVEEVIGAELSLIRGMFAAAGIDVDPDAIIAHARRYERDGRKFRSARATFRLNSARELVQLAKWLKDQGVEPVAAPAPQENES